MRAAGGYRDIHYRFGTSPSAEQTASSTATSHWR
jgi:hypothetical protein